jgi:hypothetical protein
MKKILAFCIGINLSYSVMISNPIPVPIKMLLISEIYFDSTGWTIELVANDFGGAYYKLDSVQIGAWSGAAYFKSGIKVKQGQTFIITQDSLKTPLYINQKGDYISLWETNGEHLLWDLQYYQIIEFGDYSFDACSTPYEGQSLVAQRFKYSNNNSYFYCLVKERIPTLGTFPFQCHSRDTFKGYITDKYNRPIKNGIIHCSFGNLNLQIKTNDTGYFENDTMFSARYTGLLYVGDSFVSVEYFNIELDSSNLYAFKLDNYVDAIQDFPDYIKASSITNYPNPFINKTTFDITLPKNLNFKNPIIKIYNNSGQIVEIIPVRKHDITSNHFSIEWESKGTLCNGEYYYSLEVDNNKVAENKMVITK